MVLGIVENSIEHYKDFFTATTGLCGALWLVVITLALVLADRSRQGYKRFDVVWQSALCGLAGARFFGGMITSGVALLPGGVVVSWKHDLLWVLTSMVLLPLLVMVASGWMLFRSHDPIDRWSLLFVAPYTLFEVAFSIVYVTDFASRWSLHPQYNQDAVFVFEAIERGCSLIGLVVFLMLISSFFADRSETRPL
jgi:hypothetical protein